MQNIHISFSQDWSFGIVVLIALGSLALSIYFYQKHARYLTTSSLTTLMLLRVAAMVVLLMGLFRPVVSFEKFILQKAPLLLLVDTSRSMSIQDRPNQGNRLQRVKNIAQQLSETLKKDFDVSWFAFDTQARALKDVEELEDLKADGDATDIATSVKEASKSVDRAATAGVILFTDGNDNSQRRTLEEVKSLGFKVYTVGVGTRLRSQGDFRDIALKSVEFARFLTVKKRAQLDVFIEAIGLRDAVVPVLLRDADGNLLAQDKLVLDDTEGAQKVTLSYTPQVKGKFALEALVPPQPPERISENNSQMFQVEVIDPKIRILYIEGAVRSEYKFLLRTLQAEPNIEVLGLVQVRKGTFYQQGNVEDIQLTGFPQKKEDMKKFDVFIFGDIDSTYFSLEQMKLLKEVISEGAGFLMIGGYSSFGPGGYAGTPIEEILPVFCGPRDVPQEKEPFVFELTAEGESHPVFSGIADFFIPSLAPTQLPPLLGAVHIPGIKPGAVTLSVHPDRENEKGPLCILAVQQYGKGRSAAFAADTTWRWFFQMRPLGKDSPYVRFWVQLIRWLASRTIVEEGTGPGVFAYADKSYYMPGEKVVLSAQVRSEDGLLTKNALVKATLKEPKGIESSLQLLYVRGTAGNYEAVFKPPTPGKYLYEISASVGGKNVGTTKVNFVVGKPMLEFEKLDLDEDFLKKISVGTGGSYYPLVNVSQLAQSLVEKRERLKVFREMRLWHPVVFFIIFVSLITAEWILRKRHRLI